MKKFLLLCILFLVNIPFKAQNQQEAERLLDKTYEKIKRYEKFVLKFIYQWNYPEENIQNTKEGILYVSREKYRLELMDIIQICDGNKIYSISKKDKEITISDIKNDENLLSLIQTFDTYRKNYTSTKAQLKKIGKKKIQFIHLEPKEKKAIGPLMVGIDINNYKLYQITEMGKDSSTTITIRKKMPWTNANLSLLKFDPKDYPDHMLTNLD